jgi:hypothetical protein
MKKFLSLIVTATLMAGCGGGGGPPTAGGSIVGGSPGSGGGGDTTTPVYSMGSGSGTAFQAGQIAGNGSGMLSAGGSTSLTVSIVDQQNVLYVGDELAVNFNSPCIAQGLATINTPATTSTGIATATYVAKGCGGTDLVTATAAVGSQNLTATTTLTVATAAVGSIEFVSAEPDTIALRGASGPGRPETSTVVFKVKDSTGGVRANTPVRFDLVSTLGGDATFEPETATSDVNGNVQTIVRSGTVATTVAIKATVTGSTSIFTQSSNLAISTGLTDGNSISLSVACNNVEAWSVDGESVAVTVRMADRFNNPAADGTPANFRTEGGKIGASCVSRTIAGSAGAPGESGVCTVNWVSQSPRPADGRSSLLVSTTGEESFVDSNGNGVYDNGDSGFTDRGEPFLDEGDADNDTVDQSDVEDGIRQPNEPFVDFNGNSLYDAADGKFNGVLCNHSSNCSTQQTTAVSDTNVIIMSGSTAFVTPFAGNTVITGSNLPFGTVTFLITDVNNQQMPAGTTVELEVDGVKLTGPDSYTWPCSAAEGGAAYSFTLLEDADPQGSATLTITTPKGVVTIYSYSVGP